MNQDDTPQAASSTESQPTDKPSANKGGWKRVATISATAVIIILLGIVLYNRYYIGSKTDSTSVLDDFPSKFKTENKVKLVESPINGERVSAADAARHPLGVVIENTPDARPQSGLDKASIVYEAETEGGITRFLGIFGSNAGGNDEIGPIRSARSFFVDWVQEYDGYFTHAGQALDAGQKILAEGVMDLSGYDGGTRTNYNGVASEHTLYNKLSNLYDQAKSKKYSANAKFTSLQFKDDATLDNRGAQNQITVGYGGNYTAIWNYDKETNIYKRSLGVNPHIMRHSNTQLTAKNIIVQVVNRTPLALPGAKPTYKFQTTGSGKGTVYADGKAADVTWKKEGKSRTKFYDTDGVEIKFNRGVSWYEIVPPEVVVSAS